eukprot:612288-Prymnesium_polylepis.1
MPAAEGDLPTTKEIDDFSRAMGALMGDLQDTDGSLERRLQALETALKQSRESEASLRSELQQAQQSEAKLVDT